MADDHYHNEFKIVGSDKKASSGKVPKVAVALAAAAGSVDPEGKQWNNLYEWLATSSIKSVKKWWLRALAGNGFCSIYHRDKDWHVPANCPLLKELNLKLIWSPPPAGTPTAAPIDGTPAVSLSPGGRSADADDALASGSSNADVAPLGLIATVCLTLAGERKR